MELPTSFTACSVRLRWAASCHWCMHQLCAFITSAGAVIAARVRFHTHRSRFVTMRSISFCTDMQLNHCEKSISTLALMIITMHKLATPAFQLASSKSISETIEFQNKTKCGKTFFRARQVVFFHLSPDSSVPGKQQLGEYCEKRQFSERHYLKF